MKKILLAALLFCAGNAMAVVPQTVNQSSFTQTNDSGYIPAMFLDKVIVGVATAGGTLVIYNSTYTTSVAISSVSLATVNTYNFDNLAVRGIYYKSTTATNGVTIIYKN